MLTLDGVSTILTLGTGSVTVGSWKISNAGDFVGSGDGERELKLRLSKLPKNEFGLGMERRDGSGVDVAATGETITDLDLVSTDLRRLSTLLCLLATSLSKTGLSVGPLTTEVASRVLLNESITC